VSLAFPPAQLLNANMLIGGASDALSVMVSGCSEYIYNCIGVKRAEETT
jgi:hypothetical protein